MLSPNNARTPTSVFHAGSTHLMGQDFLSVSCSLRERALLLISLWESLLPSAGATLVGIEQGRIWFDCGVSQVPARAFGQIINLSALLSRQCASDDTE